MTCVDSPSDGGTEVGCLTTDDSSACGTLLLIIDTLMIMFIHCLSVLTLAMK